MQRLERLASAPRPPGCKKLRGGDSERRIRVGDYRIVYEIDDVAKTVDVTRIAHRRSLRITECPKTIKGENESSTVRSTRTKVSEARTDWKRLDKRKDSDVRRAIKADPDAAPELDNAWFRRAKLVVPEPKHAVSIRRDRDGTEWFKRQGRGWGCQTRINAVLRTYVEAQQ